MYGEEDTIEDTIEDPTTTAEEQVDGPEKEASKQEDVWSGLSF